MDDFKRHIEGWRGHGWTCPCCRETTKRHSRKLARQRLKERDYRDMAEQVDALDSKSGSFESVGSNPTIPTSNEEEA